MLQLRSLSEDPRALIRFVRKFTTTHAAKAARSDTVLFPGSGIRVGRAGFGSPWLGAIPDRSRGLAKALRGGCNLVELQQPAPARGHEEGTADPPQSWEMNTIKSMEAQGVIDRGGIALLSTVPAGELSVSEALAPGRVLERLGALLEHHGVEHLDALVLEVPSPAKVGATGATSQQQQAEEEVEEEHRRSLQVAVREVLAGVLGDSGGGGVKTLGFSWSQENPHDPYKYPENATGGGQSRATQLLLRTPPSPLLDVLAARDEVAPGAPLTAMFPVGLGAAASAGYDEACSEGGGFALPPEAGVFQIGTRVLHTEREDGRPFRFVDLRPANMVDAVRDLASCLNRVLHLEVTYQHRFADGPPGGGGVLLPEREEVSWGHILAQNQDKMLGLDEWLVIQEHQIRPAMLRTVQVLQSASSETAEWAAVYRAALAALLEGYTAVMESEKADTLAEAVARIDTLCPSLATTIPDTSTRGDGGGGGGSGGSGNDGGKGAGAATAGDGATPGAGSVMGRCVRAALATGVDVVLAEEFVSAGGTADLAEVPSRELRALFRGFQLPIRPEVPEGNEAGEQQPSPSTATTSPAQ